MFIFIVTNGIVFLIKKWNPHSIPLFCASAGISKISISSTWQSDNVIHDQSDAVDVNTANDICIAVIVNRLPFSFFSGFNANLLTGMLCDSHFIGVKPQKMFSFVFENSQNV
jgi:hypothetical protein